MNAHDFFYLIGTLSFVLGLLIYLNPQKIIVIQKKFYTLINWNIEPISMSKEVRNTRLMGLFLMAFTIGVLTAFWLNLFKSN